MTDTMQIKRQWEAKIRIKEEGKENRGIIQLERSEIVKPEYWQEMQNCGINLCLMKKYCFLLNMITP